MTDVGLDNLNIKKAAVIAIFGATGDLSQRKLMPALFDLYQKRILPKKIRIIGVSHTEISEKKFKALIKKAILRHNHFGSKQQAKKKLPDFLDRLTYLQADFNKQTDYFRLAERFRQTDAEFKTCSTKVLYLSTPPKFYANIIKHLTKANLHLSCADEDSWTRIVVEKPFGRDYESARQLDNLLSRTFQEDQIFRIDHYLGKETAQNILTFRFANTVFEPLWNKEFIEKVEISLLEKDGVAGRVNFYDGVGALRDVGENHLLQLLALVAMEEPADLKQKSLRQRRAEVIESIKPINLSKIKEEVIRGQYTGYQNEKGVKKNSKTETYFKLKLFLNQKRWQGVPFYLESGRALAKKQTEIRIYFKKTKECSNFGMKADCGNVLIFNIEPREGIEIDFWVKRPGFNLSLIRQNLSFYYTEIGKHIHLPQPYEHLIWAVLKGDRSLFASTGEVQASWHFITPVLKNWQALMLHKYQPGSKGPEVELS